MKKAIIFLSFFSALSVVINFMMLVSSSFLIGAHNILYKITHTRGSISYFDRKIHKLTNKNRSLKKTLKKQSHALKIVKRRIKHIIVKKASRSISKSLPVIGTAAVLTLDGIEAYEMCNLLNVVQGTLSITESEEQENDYFSRYVLKICSLAQ